MQQRARHGDIGYSPLHEPLSSDEQQQLVESRAVEETPNPEPICSPFCKRRHLALYEERDCR